MRIVNSICMAAALLLAGPAAQAEGARAAAADAAHPQLEGPTDLAEGDYDPANPPRRLRVLVAKGPSTFFFRNGAPHGVEQHMLAELELFLNRNRPASRPPTRVLYVPIEQGELIAALVEGRGDMAAGLMPVLPSVAQLVRYTEPYLTDAWCLVRHRERAALADLSALQETPLTLPKAGFARRLVAGHGEVRVMDAVEGASAESLLLSINSGGDTVTLASRYVFKLWQKRLPNLRLDGCVDEAVPVAWAVSPRHTQLLDELNRFIAAKGRLASQAAAQTQRLLPVDGRAVLPERAAAGLDRLAVLGPVFRMVAAANDMDWLLLAAIGQRESKLRAVKRENGPTGVMQVNPSTARKMGVKDPHGNEGNITAAARYLSYLRRLFTHSEITEDDQLYFMLAAYNAGEGRVQQLRRQAAREGLDPNRWGGNVELVARRMVGQRLLDYVSSVNRFYLAYQAAERLPAPSMAAASAVEPR
ncbi:transglycosylase SLT domain-containing protein [Chitiniphilus purpureus]|uniref:Transglycosylase SLT domain-containing protein n=1 Tax=Chitiniphilus purpureus TaxID=2981137 RepID=A0ABY6DKA8_9NEIS|nr:transglycosylase SLT domain-containing protein [Chitiniphilus sp. CD1]UXY14123.1 transglycosylase SLT domain-containing protein [Chitiniphilus sp. CD1]